MKTTGREKDIFANLVWIFLAVCGIVEMSRLMTGTLHEQQEGFTYKIPEVGIFWEGKSMKGGKRL